MNSNRVLVIEFGIGVAVSSWAAMKKNYWPWPPSIVRIAIAFAVLGVLATVAEEMAALLGAGFILADFVRVYNAKQPFVGGVPINDPKVPFPLLTLGGTPTATSQNLAQPANNTNAATVEQTPGNLDNPHDPTGTFLNNHPTLR